MNVAVFLNIRQTGLHDYYEKILIKTFALTCKM